MVNFRGGCISLLSLALALLVMLILYTISFNITHDAELPWWVYLVGIFVFLILRPALSGIVKALTGSQRNSQSPGAYQQSAQPYYQPPPPYPQSPYDQPRVQGQYPPEQPPQQ